ncbi:MAG: hypothetical protein MZV63_42705 [Marinilabiliales bacterium]|nr:hypothetical protein [Marinilabiliales bacterium]
MQTSRFEDVSNRNIVAFLDLAENQANIYNTIPAVPEHARLSGQSRQQQQRPLYRSLIPPTAVSGTSTRWLMPLRHSIPIFRSAATTKR